MSGHRGSFGRQWSMVTNLCENTIALGQRAAAHSLRQCRQGLRHHDTSACPCQPNSLSCSLVIIQKPIRGASPDQDRNAHRRRGHHRPGRRVAGGQRFAAHRSHRRCRRAQFDAWAADRRAPPPPIAALLLEVQHDLFDLGGELSIPGYTTLTDEQVLRIEAAVEQFNADLPPLKEFILPGGTRAAGAGPCLLAPYAGAPNAPS